MIQMVNGQSSILFWLLFALWALSEVNNARRSGRAAAGRSRADRGSALMIVAAVMAGMSLCFTLGWLGVAPVPPWASAVGLALMLAGLGVREWAVRTLGRHFTMQVSTASGQEVVERGPYRYVRHPSYTGSLLTVAGAGLALGSWLGAALALGLCLVAYSYRAAVEERALLAALPGYGEYVRRTWRFFPGL